MSDKPRRETQILNKNFFIVLIISGSIMALLTLGTFYFAFNILEQSIKDARTTALITLIMLEVAGAFNFRSFRKTTLNRSPLVNPYLALASAGSILATILVVYTPLNRFFETMPVPFIDWLIAIVIALFFILIIDTLKKINNRKKLLELEH